MGRKRIHHNDISKERNRENARQYYYQHREEILARQKKERDLNKKPKTLKKDVLNVLKEWNEQLYQKLQENLPKWLEIAVKDQITMNNTLINQYEQGNL